MPLTSIFKPVTKKKQTDIKWENVLSQSPFKGERDPVLGCTFQEGLKWGHQRQPQIILAAYHLTIVFLCCFDCIASD